MREAFRALVFPFHQLPLSACCLPVGRTVIIDGTKGSCIVRVGGASVGCTIRIGCTDGSSVGRSNDARSFLSAASITAFVNLAIAVIIHAISADFHSARENGRVVVITISASTFAAVLEKAITVSVAVLETAKTVEVPRDWRINEQKKREGKQELHGDQRQ